MLSRPRSRRKARQIEPDHIRPYLLGHIAVRRVHVRRLDSTQITFIFNLHFDRCNCTFDPLFSLFQFTVFSFLTAIYQSGLDWIRLSLPRKLPSVCVRLCNTEKSKTSRIFHADFVFVRFFGHHTEREKVKY